MALNMEEESLVIDSGRTGGYYRILTETSIEASPKLLNQRARVLEEDVTSRIETERVHTEMVGSKVKSTFQYFRKPPKGIHSVAREKEANELSIVAKNARVNLYQSKSRTIKQPKLSLFGSKTAKKTQSNQQNNAYYQSFQSTPMKAPLKTPVKKYLNLSESKTTSKTHERSIDATNDSLSRLTLTNYSRSKIPKPTKIHALGKHLHPVIQNISRKN